ncbi:MAG: AraC family transcriptional regulator [Sulfurospirillum cavolei]|nr:AraC family transcriptional regulator [Sulfurospirillum cavolei]
MKESTREDYVRLVYKVVFYIEQNADKELSLEELSRIAGFSKFHFHRIFKAVTGENIGDFIARVRLVYSAWKLKTEPKITDVALSCGFETNASFSKAFKNRFGVSPRAYAAQLKAKKRSGDAKTYHGRV